MTAALTRRLARLPSDLRLSLAGAMVLDRHAQTGRNYNERLTMRRQILAKMGDPDQTQYYQLQMRDLDTAISLERGDWCHWLIHTQPGYGDLMTSIERRRYGKTYPKYLKLDQMLAKHTANNNQN